MCRNMASFLKFYFNSGWLKSEKSLDFSTFIFHYNLLALKKIKLLASQKKGWWGDLLAQVANGEKKLIEN